MNCIPLIYDYSYMFLLLCENSVIHVHKKEIITILRVHIHI
jgi:hypothetical protein